MTLDEVRELLPRESPAQAYISAIKAEVFEELERIKLFNKSVEMQRIREAHMYAAEKARKPKEREPDFKLPES